MRTNQEEQLPGSSLRESVCPMTIPSFQQRPQRSSMRPHGFLAIVLGGGLLALAGCGTASAATLAIEMTASGITHSFTPGFTAYIPQDGAEPFPFYVPPSSYDSVVFDIPVGGESSLNGISRLEILLLAPTGSLFSLAPSSFPLSLIIAIQATVSSQFVLPGETSVRLLDSSVPDLAILAAAAQNDRIHLHLDIRASTRITEPLPNPLTFSGLLISVDLPDDYGDESLALGAVNMQVRAAGIGDTGDPGQYLRLVPEPSTAACFLASTLAVALRRVRRPTSGC